MSNLSMAEIAVMFSIKTQEKVEAVRRLKYKLQSATLTEEVSVDRCFNIFEKVRFSSRCCVCFYISSSAFLAMNFKRVMS